jgi:OOP family OmpA-OmpF porin
VSGLDLTSTPRALRAHVARGSIALAALACATGCATGASLGLEADAMTTRLETARQSGAYACAPRELARAEAELDFLRVEIDQGHALRAAEHRDEARAALTQVIDKLRVCAPPAPPAPPKPADRDGDGVLDVADACPDRAGLPAFRGCPDRDGDNIGDDVDKCPDAPEDYDQFEDKDGCPESQDRDGDGVPDEQDVCPEQPGPASLRGCPERDRDRDGIKDDLDRCPDDAEDRDGFEDADGCPDLDNDGDGIKDVSDKCVDVPETKNGYQDDDGCPDVDPTLVRVNLEAGKIEIKQKVFFDTNKATIKSVSYRLLNEVASALRGSPNLEILVEGHTDSVGNDASNLRLSSARASAVREYLIGQGIDPQRLTAIGFGETRPITSNASAAGREQNRRVEFTIVKE